MKINFEKYHNCGNDFIIIEGLKKDADIVKNVSKGICKHKYSIGADNVLFLCESEVADAFMGIFNITDVEGDMCGNGSLCVGSFLNKKHGKNEFTIETISGIVTVKKGSCGDYIVDMGNIKTTYNGLKKFFNYDLDDNDSTVDLYIDGIGKCSIVQIGEPHVVIFVDNLCEVPIKKIGDQISSFKGIFPLGIEINFVEIVNNNTIKAKFYERSCFDQTESCGTGACCSAFVSNLLGKIKSKSVDVVTNGGLLKVKISNNGLVLHGYPKKIFDGTIEVDCA
jgi:diaminopimelate epimerase